MGPKEITGSSKRKWSNKFIEELKQIDLGETAYQVLHTYIVELENLKKQVSIIDKQIRELSKTKRYSKNVSLLLSVPSIGVLTAMIILTEIGDIRRFKTLDQLCSYVGLIPNTKSSGEKEKVGKNTKRGNHYIKSKIIECAWTSVRKDPGLLLSYKSLCCRMKGNEAIIRIAKKLLSRIRYILINQEEYVTGLTN